MSHQDLAGRSRLRGGARPAWAAAIPCGLGLAICVFVLSRFGLRQVARGRGDHWAAGGAPGISALATRPIGTGSESPGRHPWAH